MMLVDHAQTSQGFSGGFSVGVKEAKASGGDEPGVYVRVAGASSHENHHVAPKSATRVVFPIDILWWSTTPMRSRLSINNLGRPGSAWQIPPLHPLSAIWNRARISGECWCGKRIK